MPLKTAAEQLAEVQSAITDLLASGQTVEIDGQRLTMADLDLLTKREDVLITRVAREARSARGISVSVGTQRR